MSKPTKYELAHEEARRNAIKLLGLHEKNTAKDRARAMGFSTAPAKEMYHGARGELQGDIDPSRSDLGFHAGTMEQANNRLKAFAPPRQDYPEGANISPLSVSKYANLLKLNDEGSFHADAIAPQMVKKKIISREKALQIMQDIGDDYKKQKDYDAQMRKALEQHGYHGGKYSNEQEGSGKSIVVTDPSVLRSRFAAYDPARAHEPDLLAAKGGAVKKYAAGGAATKDKALSIGDFYAHFPNIEKHIDLEHEPRPFHFELPPEMRGKHTGFDIRANHKIPNGAVKERVIVSPKAHEVEYDRASLKHFVKQGK